MKGFSRYQRDALFYYFQIAEVADFYTKHNLWAIAAVRDAILKRSPRRGDFRRTAVRVRMPRSWGVSRMVRALEQHSHERASGTYYMPQVSQEEPPLKPFVNKLDRLS